MVPKGLQSTVPVQKGKACLIPAFGVTFLGHTKQSSPYGGEAAGKGEMPPCSLAQGHRAQAQPLLMQAAGSTASLGDKRSIILVLALPVLRRVEERRGDRVDEKRCERKEAGRPAVWQARGSPEPGNACLTSWGVDVQRKVGMREVFGRPTTRTWMCGKERNLKSLQNFHRRQELG